MAHEHVRDWELKDLRQVMQIIQDAKTVYFNIFYLTIFNILDLIVGAF
jgi:hypothetical protein